MTTTDLAQRTAQLKTKCDQAHGALDTLQPQLAAAQAKHAKLQQDQQLWREVQALLGHLAEVARETMRSRIEETVTAALQAVFPEPLTFRVVLRQVGGQPVADWEVVSVYGDIEVAAEPESAKGGGVTDVVSLALRLALMELSRPKVQGPLIIDEPMKMLSVQYLPALAEFLKEYARRTERQIVAVTHHQILADIADQSLLVTQRYGRSEVKVA